jgi:hypothetical protein
MAITGRHITTIAKVIAPRLLRPLPLEQFRDRGGPARHDAVVPGLHAVAARIGSHTPRGGAAVVLPIDGRHVPRALAATTQAGVAASLVGATTLHVGWAKRVDAVRQTVSDYALDEDANKVFAATVACLSVASTSLLASVVRSRFPVGIAPTALLGTWCAGLALCAAFRTDPIDSPPTVDGVVHRCACACACACAVAVAALPAAGLLVARRIGRLPALKATARSLRLMSWASTAPGAVFLGTHLCAQAPAAPAARWIGGRHGLAERVA